LHHTDRALHALAAVEELNSGASAMSVRKSPVTG
jgi:hypothetical protein